MVTRTEVLPQVRKHLLLGSEDDTCSWFVADILQDCGLKIPSCDWEAHLQFRKIQHFIENGEQKLGDDEVIKESYPVCYLLINLELTLMNTGCSVFGPHRILVSCCFQALPTHFTEDQPVDPVLILSQTIIHPKSNTSWKYGVLIHISLWLNKSKALSWVCCCQCTLSLLVCLLVAVCFGLSAQLKIAVLKLCCALQ